MISRYNFDKPTEEQIALRDLDATRGHIASFSRGSGVHNRPDRVYLVEKKTTSTPIWLFYNGDALIQSLLYKEYKFDSCPGPFTSLHVNINIESLGVTPLHYWNGTPAALRGTSWNQMPMMDAFHREEEPLAGE